MASAIQWNKQLVVCRHFIDVNTGWAVGKSGIILKTTDGGTNWVQQSIGTTDLEEEKNNIPVEFTLIQNYPNPFNPSTVIEFSLPENVGNVKLSIYNALGEKVAELVNTALTAGKYQYQWNAQNVATGMYIYELTN
ncbi:MAG: T9SS type A sorting domain-containing protein [Ignavibacteriales bacterium]|nr:T9SS type A sorting domain-containing protein [Ignavibacteriales bacterium]